MKNILKIGVSFLITGVLLWWVLKDINWKDFGDEFARLNYLVLVPGLLAMIAHYYIRSYRWKFLLKDGENVKLQTLFDSIMIGNFGTYLLPLRAGEFMRPFMLSRKSGIPFSTAFGSVVIERFFDLSCVLLSFGALLNFIDQFEPWVYQGAKALCVLAAGIMVFIAMCVLLPRQIIGLAEFSLQFFPEKLKNFAIKFITDFITAADPLRDIVKLIMVTALSVVVWLSVFAIFYLFFFLTPSVEPSLIFSVTVSVIIALAVAAPSAPGFIGVYQTACVAAFAIFGFSKEAGLVYALVTHLLHYAVFLLYGSYILSRDGFKLAELRK